MKINPMVVSFGVALIITLVFIFILFFIFLRYLGVSDSPSAAFDNLGSWFGGIATLWAAIVAAYLFNDWKEAQRFNIAKDVLIALIKLKSHIDKNYQNARNHLDSYSLENRDPPPSMDYIAKKIKAAKNCLPEKEKHKFDANILLTILYEKIDIYQITCNDILIKDEDRVFNFPNHIFQISNMYEQARNGNLESIEILKLLGESSQSRFESEYYNKLINKLKKKAQIQV